MQPSRKSWSRRVSTLALPLMTAAAMAVACGGGNENLPPPPPPPPLPTSEAPAPAPTPEAPAAPETPKAPPPPVTLTRGAALPEPAAPTPTVAITAPTKNQVIPTDKAGQFAVKLDVKHWPTAHGSNHVHLILDDKPYVAVFDPKTPTKLAELAHGEAIGEGLHVLVAFPSRPNHESVKTKGALALVPFWVGKRGSAKEEEFTKKPLLIYSQPKGAYDGEMANHVLVDFYVANVTLAEGKAHVFVTVTGPGIEAPLEAKVDAFGTPLYLDNLQDGSYSVKVELVDGANKVIEGPWNSTTRTITVDREAPSDPAAAHGAPAAGPKPPPAPVNTTPPPAPSPTMTAPLPPMGGGQ